MCGFLLWMKDFHDWTQILYGEHELTLQSVIQADKGRDHDGASKNTKQHYSFGVIFQHKASEALTMTPQLLDCVPRCKMALVHCECVGNRGCLFLFFERKHSREKWQETSRAFWYRAKKVSQSTWERRDLAMSRPSLKANVEVVQ